MGNFSKSSKPDSAKKQPKEPGKNQNTSTQLKDNRAEHTTQLKFSQLANSQKGNQSDQSAEVDPEKQQRKRVEEELQRKSEEPSVHAATIQNPLAIPVQRVENNTGLPDNLKSGIENLSGYSMDDVNVHYNSSQPSQLESHAYAQGTDIHVAPGQEEHLPHEAWHVVQQKQGRVKATRQLKGKVNINDNEGLEREADLMGGRALQLKGKASNPQKTILRTGIVQRVTDEEKAENNRMTDSRMDSLVKRVLAILGVLTAQGEDWEKTYGDKGKKLGQQGVEKAKGALLGSEEDKGPSLKERVVKEGLKRWWASLEPEEKAEMFTESAGFFSSIFGGSSSKKAGEKEKRKVPQEGPEKPKREVQEFESNITSLNMEKLIETYKGYAKIKRQIEEFEKGVKGLAEELGSDVGVKVGEFRNEHEFTSKFEEQRVPYKVARLEYAFLKETIEKNNTEGRYKGELDALSDALDIRLKGPSAMINNPGRFTGDKNQMAGAVGTCLTAYENLQIANVVRNGTTSLLSNLGIGIDKFLKAGKEFLGGIFGSSPEEQQVDPKIGQKQGELVIAIQAVCGKSWYSHTSGLLAFTPDGVKEVGEKLAGNKSAGKKLTAIKAHLTKPEEDLVDTENKLTAVDKQLSGAAGKLQKDINLDRTLKETRSEKSTEKFVGKQVDNVSELADSGLSKVELEVKKRNLKKKIRGDNRKPLTQVFYNAIKDFQPDNLTSLGKTIAIMEQIGQELDTTKHTENL